MKRKISNQIKKIMKKGCIAVLLVTAVLSGCGQKEETPDAVQIEKEQGESPYILGVADYGEVVLGETLSCTYRQVEDQEVAFRVSGRVIDKIYVNIGDAVHKGDLLAELVSGNQEEEIARLAYSISRNQLLLEQDKEDLQNQLDQMNVQYTYFSGQSSAEWVQLQKDIEKAEKEHRYIREDYEDAIAVDQMALDLLQEESDASRVYATMDGTVYAIEPDLEGTVCVKDERIMLIVDSSECLFETENPEYASYFKEDVTVQMKIPTGEAQGEYVLVPYAMDTWGDKQYFAIKESSSTGEIKVGARGNLLLVMDKRENVLRVPSEAVHSADDKKYVYTVGEDGMRMVVWVEAGLIGNKYAEILSGISEGDKVILK